MPAPTAPQVVVQITPHEMVVNFQGAWEEETTYQLGHWVSYEEGLYKCVQAGAKKKPALAGTEYWKFIGSLPS